MTANRPIFIVGSPRSGTTLLRSILDAHPNICCPQWETGVFVALSQMLDRDTESHAANDSLIGGLRPRMLTWTRDSVCKMMEELTSGISKPRWAEKTPAHVLHVRLIHEVFPEAQIIHIIRNGREVVRSLQNMDWTPQKIRWSTRFWMECVATGQRDGSQLPSDNYHELRYEQLTQDPDNVVRQLCNFLKEEFHEVMLEFNRPENNSWQLSQQSISKTPINKHRELGFWERLAFNRIAGTKQKELGYHYK